MVLWIFFLLESHFSRMMFTNNVEKALNHDRYTKGLCLEVSATLQSHEWVSSRGFREGMFLIEIMFAKVLGVFMECKFFFLNFDYFFLFA